MSLEKKEIIDWYMTTFANKTLSFGCLVSLWMPNDWSNWVHLETHTLTQNYKCAFDWEQVFGFCDIIDDYELQEWDRDKTIGHPLTRGRLSQEVRRETHKLMPSCWFFSVKDLIDLMNLLDDWLWFYWLLDQTVYDWVKEEKILDILVKIKELYEWKK